LRILLDTHVLVWALDQPTRLPSDVREALESSENEVLFSVASIWELAIKSALGRPDFRYTPAEILESALETGFIEVPITSAAAVKVASLPLHHRDPFDRLLVAQAMIEPALLYTADPQLEPYSELVRRI
jgi:PIN domain nuclease of toxin-antitoxin system